MESKSDIELEEFFMCQNEARVQSFFITDSLAQAEAYSGGEPCHF